MLPQMSRLRLPHPLTLLVACVLVAAILTHIVPAGEFARREDTSTGQERELVVPGSFHSVAAKPVSAFETFVAIPKGMGKASDIIFLVFLVGGAFSVVDRTGAFRGGVTWLVRRLEGRESLVIPIFCAAFALGGVLDGMFEEIIPMIPVLLVLTRRLGFDGITAIAMSAGAALVGGTFSPICPFNVGLGQKLAELPLMSGALFRVAVLVPALGIWTWGTLHHAALTRSAPVRDEGSQGDFLETRHVIGLLLVVVTLGAYVFGVLQYGWGFDQMSGLFLVMGIAVGLTGRLGITGTAEGFVEGFKSMALAALLIGVARAIYVVLDEGRIVDTMINALVLPLSHLPVWLFALGMTGVQTLVSVPVPSASGQATLTLPILVPVSDLLGLSRQVTVLAYQYGNGVLIFTPTLGALMAMLATAGVRYEKWLKFAVPLSLGLFVLALAAVGFAVVIGLK
jgi:uncharacterized ion transporter superfamily protein YfcC